MQPASSNRFLFINLTLEELEMHEVTSTILNNVSGNAFITFIATEIAKYLNFLGITVPADGPAPFITKASTSMVMTNISVRVNTRDQQSKSSV